MVVWIPILAAALVVAAAVSPAGTTSASAATAIVARGPATVATYGPSSTRSITVAAPAGVRPGDVLVASIGAGSGAGRPAIVAPTGWTLASRTDDGVTATLAVYTHTWSSGERTYTWTTDRSVGAVALLGAFGGVDPTAPVTASAGRISGRSTVATPSVTTPSPGSMLVASFYGSRRKPKVTTWRPPAGMAETADADGRGYRSASTDIAIQAAAGSTGAKTSTPSASPDNALGALTALRPATETTPPPPPTPPPTPPPASGPVPLIVDTDLFSDADDVGALATAFGLEAKGEAKVVAIGINTRTSRPAVTTDSWRCAAAVATFYGAGSVPIGTAMPNNGTAVNTVDFVKPCGAMAPAATPVPSSAVTVFRRALAAEADGSVVVAEAGYAGNLAALLDSPADAISPLTGRQLVARKVKRLVIMGGGYPSRSGENNLNGDPVAAQKVSAEWPTTVVWAGYEVGDAIHTGHTISRTHPTTSPVRVAYEAFVGPNNWIYSYDLVAVYDAIRSTDPALGEVGPGTNVIDGTGGNRFVLGSGTQSYLTLRDVVALNASIEGLITTLPATTPPPPPPLAAGPTDTFEATTLSPAWTTDAAGSTVATSGGRLVISHPAGAWTKGALQSVRAHDQTGRSLRLQVVRPANGGAGGASTYGETTISLVLDATHQVSFFVASGTLTARVNNGATATNLTPAWPAYDAARMQWLQFRESGGRLFWEYASGATEPGPWTELASAPAPFALTAVQLRIAAGANTSTPDVASFDNVATG